MIVPEWVKEAALEACPDAHDIRIMIAGIIVGGAVRQSDVIGDGAYDPTATYNSRDYHVPVIHSADVKLIMKERYWDIEIHITGERMFRYCGITYLVTDYAKIGAVLRTS